MEQPLCDLTLHEAAELLRRREVSSEELTNASLQRIHSVEPRLKSFVEVLTEQALADARSADNRLANGETGDLLGVPLQLKDNLCTKGVATTCASKMLTSFVPPYDATVVARLRSAGAVFIGKGNMDEFAMGSSTENSAFAPTRNPWDTSRVPGGSSGGPAAAVAAGQAFYALGSDTGGSIRQPASMCGIVGLKPTYGLVSRYGLIAFASSLDQIGPMTHDVTDCAVVLNAIAGHDPLDSTSATLPERNYRASLLPNLKGLRLGVPQEYFGEGVDDAVRKSVISAIRIFEEMGASVQWDVSLPSTIYALAVYYIIAPSEASANLARYDGIKYGFSSPHGVEFWDIVERTRQEGFGEEVKRRIMLGTYSLSAGYYDAYYLRAQKVRTLIREEFDKAFQSYDALIAPTCPTTAFRLGEKVKTPVEMYLNDACTIPASIAGIPAISVPCGFVRGLPVGMQIMAKPFAEEMILRIAYAYEQATDWVKQRPKL